MVDGDLLPGHPLIHLSNHPFIRFCSYFFEHPQLRAAGARIFAQLGFAR